MWSQFYKLRGRLPAKTGFLVESIGTAVILILWWTITAMDAASTEFRLIPPSILPSPVKIITSFAELHYNDALVRNALFSLELNLLGLFEAVALALPIGFLIGLIPVFRSMFERYISVVRFLPLTALTGLFIVWFGIGTTMKVQFLAFSIFLYLLPVVIQRIDEVQDVYIQTASTCGASTWQTIKSVFLPSVLSRVYDDIIVLAALSWTYIVVAELVNANGGGVGALAYIASRQSRIDKVFGILIVIIFIGYCQDKLLKWIDRFIFPHKYATKKGR
jgi:NitT/TauT family transport system permease protein